MATIPSDHFKMFFNTTLVNQTYPQLTYKLADQKKM